MDVSSGNTRHNSNDDLSGPIFEVKLNVSEYLLNEISVVATDEYVIVQGQHEERSDSHGSISRQFRRRFQLPPGIDPDSVRSVLTAEGVLTVTIALPIRELDDSVERDVPIISVPPLDYQMADSNPNPWVTTPAA